ncbi:unnamed protein product, partial [Larinioides sclopetarius]
MTLLRSAIYFDICLLVFYIPSLIANKSCGKPPVVNNGEAILDAFSTEFPVGANIGYRCFDGFVLNTIGNSYAVCLSDNETTYWQPAVISCEPVCNHWPSLQNGRLKLGGRTPPFMPGDSIEYVCDAGFTPSRIAAKVTCTVQEGIANWTETENACKQTDHRTSRTCILIIFIPLETLAPCTNSASQGTDNLWRFWP